MTQPPHSGRHPPPPLPAEAPTSKTEILDAPLHTIGFEIDELSAQRVSGHLLITSKCCQVLVLGSLVLNVDSILHPYLKMFS